MADPKSLSKTVAQMATQTSVTLGWDVVVNYTELAINDLLMKTFEEKPEKQIRELEFKITLYDPLSQKDTDIHYDFGLAAPFLKFNARGALGPTCNLTFPLVGGTVQVEDRDAVSVPSSRYSVVIGMLKLATSAGSVDPVTTPYHQSFDFSDNTTQGCVVIDFATSSDLTVEVLNHKPPPDSPNFPLIDSYNPNICQLIKKQLLDKGKVQYEIARVKADPPPSGTIQLKPKSFRFDAFLPSDSSGSGDVGVLTLFIQTRDKNHGTLDNLATEWEYQWRKTLHCSPIPEDQTASIIFSKYMIYESVIEPALRTQGFSGEVEDTKGSLEMKVKTGKSIHRDKFHLEEGSIFYVIYQAGAIDVTLDPLKLTLSEHSGSATYTTSWEFKYTCNWFIITQRADAPDSRESGSVTVTHAMPKDSSKSAKVVTFLDDYSLTIDCSVSKDDWGIDVKTVDKTWWQKFLGGTDRLPKWVEGLHVDLPNFNLPLGRFNFFLTTNLLFPGNKKVIDINKTSGLRIPGDLYLVGKVVDK